MEENFGNGEQSASQSSTGNQQEGVVFLGWQNTASGEKIALYNVTAEHHPLYGSTVTDGTLRAHDLPVPHPPGGGENNV